MNNANDTHIPSESFGGGDSQSGHDFIDTSIETLEGIESEKSGIDRTTGIEPLELPKKRGRKAGQKNKNHADNLRNDFNDFEKSVPVSNSTHEPVKERLKITGKMLLLIVDFLVPIIISKAGGIVSEKIKNQSLKSLQLDKEEKADMLEMAEEAAKEITLNVSPLGSFLVVILIVYISKINFSDE